MSMPQYLEEKQVCLMMESKYFSCKEQRHTVYDFLKKEKIAAMVEGISEDKNSQKKE